MASEPSKYIQEIWTKTMLEACWSGMFPVMLKEMEKGDKQHAAIFRDAVAFHMEKNIIPILSPVINSALNQVIEQYTQPMTLARQIKMNSKK